MNTGRAGRPGRLVTVLIMTQLVEVAGSLTGYQANLHQKIQDIRGLSEGRRPVEPLRLDGRLRETGRQIRRAPASRRLW